LKQDQCFSPPSVRGLDEGPKRVWTIISVKSDWKSLHPGTR
jgi:hypothetical protein